MGNDVRLGHSHRILQMVHTGVECYMKKPMKNDGFSRFRKVLGNLVCISSTPQRYVQAKVDRFPQHTARDNALPTPGTCVTQGVAQPNGDAPPSFTLYVLGGDLIEVVPRVVRGSAVEMD